MFNDYLIIYCDDCERFHTYTIGETTEDGRTDLNDDDGPAYSFSDEGLAELQASQAEQWRRYFEEVAESGDDYLHEILVDRTEAQEWLIQYAEDEQGLFVLFGSVVGSSLWQMWNLLPSDVLGFATDFWKTDSPYVRPGSINTLEELRKAETGTYKLVDDTTIRATVRVQRSEESIKEEIKQVAAQRAAKENSND